MMLKSTQLKHCLVMLVCSILTLPLLAIDANGKHNDKTCYAKTAGGIELSGSCSSRKVVCNDDLTHTCSIDGVDGNFSDGIEKAKDASSTTSNNDNNTSNNVDAELNEAREKGSGMATGRRTYEPVTIKKGIDKSSPMTATPSATNSVDQETEKSIIHRDIASREKGSGMPTGKRMHKPPVVSTDETSPGKAVNRDYNSSRQNKADTIAAPDENSDGNSGGDENGNDTDGDADVDGDDDTDGDSDAQKATDYNSSRSNKNSNH